MSDVHGSGSRPGPQGRFLQGLRAELEEYAASANDPLARLAVQLVPSLGGFLAEQLSQMSARRAARQLSWLGDLLESTGLSLHEFSSAMGGDPVLSACLDVALVAAAEAFDDRKRHALRQVMRRAIARDDTIDTAYFQLATLRDLTPTHLDVLRIISGRQTIDPPSADIRSPGNSEYDAYTIEVATANSTAYADILEEWPGVELVLDAILGGLFRAGLIEDTSAKGYESDERRWLRTGYGWHLLQDLDSS